MKPIYEIMHGDRKVAWIDTHGHCKVYYKSFMPFSLYLEETDNDVDTLVNNVTNFQYWCACRLLTLDRQYAKAILNSIGALQAFTDKERAEIALSYRCLSLTDIYWVRRKKEKISFAEVNLYENHLENALVDVSLKGKQLTIQNEHLENEFAKDLSTNGVFQKLGSEKTVISSFTKAAEGQLSKEIFQRVMFVMCFDCKQVIYTLGQYDGELVSVSDIMTSKEQSIVSREAFEIYAVNKEIDPMKYILQLDAYSFYMMNILDYLVGNVDRHWGIGAFWLITERISRFPCIH